MALSLTPEEDKLCEEIRTKWDIAEDRHKVHRRPWEHFFRLYRSYNEFSDAYTSASPRGRDVVMGDGQDTWGSELFIPYSFSTVETILPRMLSNRPRMLVLPRGRASEENVENMKFLIDAQQERIRYELKLQETAKSGLIYGLGIQKVFWRTETAKRWEQVQGVHSLVPQLVEKTLFDDPDVEDVDIFDFRWDSFGSEIQNCRYLFHRTWRDTAYVMDRVASGAWRPMDEEDVRGLGPTSKYDEVINARMVAAGHRDWQGRDDQMHEVWEYHDKGRVVTILDGKVPVQVVDHPAYWHNEYPFVAFRPTTSGLKQLQGIGEIEPIEHLQLEMNTLRRQRRDNVALKLNQIIAYSDGFVEVGDMQSFPGAMWPVEGEPKDLLFPIRVDDIPNSGYQEEANLAGDIERTTGISDQLAGAGDAGATATGVQLVQAAANVRIQMKTRRMEAESVGPTCSQFGALNQQKIRENREVRIPAPPEPGVAERRWAWRQLGPTELMGEFDYVPEGGSTAPENVPQMRADSQMFMQLFANDPGVDRRLVLEHALRLQGVKQPEHWLLPDQLLPQTLPMVLEQMGMDREQIMEAIELARQNEEMDRQTPNLSQNGSAPGQMEPERSG